MSERVLYPELVQETRKNNPFMTIHQVVYEILLREIVHFHLPPKTRLRESIIAQELQVSRSPVKMALEHLTKESFVVYNGGYRVADFSTEERSQVMDIAYLIEPFSAARAAAVITNSQLDDLYKTAFELKVLLDQGSKGNGNMEYGAMMALDYKFHSDIVTIAGNHLLEEIYQQVRHRLFRYRVYFLYNPPKGMYEELSLDHLRICDALKLRDPDVARAAVRHHLSISGKAFNREIVFREFDQK